MIGLITLIIYSYTNYEYYDKKILKGDNTQYHDKNL